MTNIPITYPGDIPDGLTLENLLAGIFGKDTAEYQTYLTRIRADHARRAAAIQAEARRLWTEYGGTLSLSELAEVFARHSEEPERAYEFALRELRRNDFAAFRAMLAQIEKDCGPALAAAVNEEEALP